MTNYSFRDFSYEKDLELDKKRTDFFSGLVNLFEHLPLINFLFKEGAPKIQPNQELKINVIQTKNSTESNNNNQNNPTLILQKENQQKKESKPLNMEMSVSYEEKQISKQESNNKSLQVSIIDNSKWQLMPYQVKSSPIEKKESKSLKEIEQQLFKALDKKLFEAIKKESKPLNMEIPVSCEEKQILTQENNTSLQVAIIDNSNLQLMSYKRPSLTDILPRTSNYVVTKKTFISHALIKKYLDELLMDFFKADIIKLLLTSSLKNSEKFLRFFWQNHLLANINFNEIRIKQQNKYNLLPIANESYAKVAAIDEKKTEPSSLSKKSETKEENKKEPCVPTKEQTVTYDDEINTSSIVSDVEKNSNLLQEIDNFATVTKNCNKTLEQHSPENKNIQPVIKSISFISNKLIEIKQAPSNSSLLIKEIKEIKDNLGDILDSIKKKYKITQLLLPEKDIAQTSLHDLTKLGCTACKNLHEDIKGKNRESGIANLAILSTVIVRLSDLNAQKRKTKKSLLNGMKGKKIDLTGKTLEGNSNSLLHNLTGKKIDLNKEKKLPLTSPVIEQDKNLSNKILGIKIPLTTNQTHNNQSKKNDPSISKENLFSKVSRVNSKKICFSPKKFSQA